jgi:hypothetical protein
LPYGPSAGYDITVDITILPGSPFLQACFYALAAGIVLAATMLVRAAARRCGDSPAAAARLQQRFLVAAVAWVGAVSAASFSGLLLPRGGPPLPFVLVLTGVAVLGPVIARSQAGDRLARGLPLAWLVGFQMFRLPLELAMHRAHTEGLMPVQMSYSGWNFDILTGTTGLALAVAMMVTQVPTWIVRAWNVMGVLLLGTIVGISVASTPVFAAFGPDRINVFISWMPYTLLPTVMVLAAWAGHLIVFRALR